MDYQISLLLVFLCWRAGCLSVSEPSSVRYSGPNAVWEGDAFQISCIKSLHDPSGWTINSSLPIDEDNHLGLVVSSRRVDEFREELTLRSMSAQLFHEGDYRCDRYRRDRHSLRVLPEFLHEGKGFESLSMSRATNEYLLEVNGSVSFHCSSARDDTTPVTWYKNSRRLVEGGWSESQMSIEGADLRIEDAQEEDAGEYMCTVDTPFVTGYTDIGRIFRLNSPSRIVDLPQKLSIIRERTLELQCKAMGFPLPKITWFIGNLPALSMQEGDARVSLYSTDGGQSSSHLVVRNATFADTGVYTCRASNSLDSGASHSVHEESVFVHVRENMIQTNEDEPGLGKVLIPEEPLLLYCNTTECAHCEVVWSKDGRLLHPAPSNLEIFKNNTLLIKHATYNDTGVYNCAINRSQLDVALNASIVVQSTIKLEKFDQSSTVVQGSPLELFCVAKGSPTPIIKWFVGGQEIYEDDNRIGLLEHKGLKKGKFVIPEADWSDRNHYTCEAFNQIESVNTTTFIRIKDKLAALWPFLGICAEVIILCSIIFVYERRKAQQQCDERDTDLPAENRQHNRFERTPAADVRQRK